ncbi:uncharacterized protein LOC103510339, partial [Diaphorina citri]|uniref:Uncharacterized protein LOC103510339 n=1 Tax=Diaphorina citri TaxID=121845 RepID=A0A3Q0J0H5_DIACI
MAEPGKPTCAIPPTPRNSNGSNERSSSSGNVNPYVVGNNVFFLINTPSCIEISIEQPLNENERVSSNLAGFRNHNMPSNSLFGDQTLSDELAPAECYIQNITCYNRTESNVENTHSDGPGGNGLAEDTLHTLAAQEPSHLTTLEPAHHTPLGPGRSHLATSHQPSGTQESIYPDPYGEFNSHSYFSNMQQDLLQSFSNPPGSHNPYVTPSSNYFNTSPGSNYSSVTSPN